MEKASLVKSDVQLTVIDWDWETVLNFTREIKAKAIRHEFLQAEKPTRFYWSNKIMFQTSKHIFEFIFCSWLMTTSKLFSSGLRTGGSCTLVSSSVGSNWIPEEGLDDARYHYLILNYRVGWPAGWLFDSVPESWWQDGACFACAAPTRSTWAELYPGDWG